MFGLSDDSEREPLLPQHRDQVKQPEVITGHQANLDKKLHTYLLARALGKGYLPSTDQSTVLLRKLLASDVLKRNNQNLTGDGRKFVDLSRKLIGDTIELIRTKNEKDEIQNFLWTVRKARLHVDVASLSSAVAVDTSATNAKAAYNSLTTIASLLLSNSDFNKLFSDVTTIFRQVLATSASTAAKYTEVVAEEIEPSTETLEAVKEPANPDQPKVEDETRDTVAEVGQTIVEGAQQIGNDALVELKETATPERTNAMKQRVRDAIVGLRQNADYNTSVSTVSILLKSYLSAYSSALHDVAAEVTDDVKPNKALNRAGALMWSFISSFGERKDWEALKEKFDALLSHKDKDPEFENIVSIGVDSLYRLLTDPDYLFKEDGESSEKLTQLQEKFKDMAGEESLKHDLDALLVQLQRVYVSIRNDKQITNVKDTIYSIGELVLPPAPAKSPNRNLLSDIVQVLGPLALQTVQYIPIPRVTLISPDLDLLLEPLVLEPGRTVNSSSFFPYKLGVVTTNEIDVYKGKRRTGTYKSSTARIKIEGMTIKAEDVGYIMKLHKNWLLRFTDSGLASFRLDEKGMDVFLDLEFTTSSIDELVILKGVSVKLHKLDYTLRRSKFSILAWVFKPLLKPILRKLIQESIRDALEEGLRALNRELIYARERLRATQVANPDDIMTFIRAIMARWQAPDDVPVDLSIGWRAHRANGRAEAPFDGQYAPGSLATLIESEGIDAEDRVEEGDEGGWKNECFTI